MKLWAVVVAGGLMLAGSAPAEGQFFKGNTVRIVTGAGPGGLFDLYSRLLARHMGKHIPGTPTIIVENMTGAGMLIAANHVYNAAKPDGLTIGNFLGGLLLQQVLGGSGAAFDARKFEFIGVPSKAEPLCYLSKKSGIRSMEEWMAAKAPVKIGASGPGSSGYDVPMILKEILGLPVQVISGYKGMAQVRITIDGGEVDGGCWTWDGPTAAWFEGKDIAVVVYGGTKRHPAFPKVPLAIDYAKTDEGRQLIETGIHGVNAMLVSYVLPPGTPKDRIQTLRKAFMDTMKDPQFVEDGKKSKVDIDPVTGSEMERIVEGFYKLHPSVAAKLREIMLPKK